MKKRSSNIELLRILMMLMIISHHLVVNSNIYHTAAVGGFNIKSIVVFWFGFGGKIGLNVFLLITGYFMCTSTVKVKRWFKIFLEYTFYAIVINVGFIIAGYHPKGYGDIADGMLPFFLKIGIGTDYYPTLFLALLLLIPFLNIIINNLSKKEFKILLIILLFFFTIVGTFGVRFDPEAGRWYSLNVWEGIGWYCTAFLIGAYIRKHVPKKFDNLKTGIISSLVCLAIAYISIIVILHYNMPVSQYHLVAGSGKILAIGTAVCIFILFKNIDIGYNGIINKVASCTFGVLLLHSNSATERDWIWNKIFKVEAFYKSSTIVMLGKMALTVLILYTVCTIIALVVNQFILGPIYRKLDKVPFMNKTLYSE